MVCTLAYEGTVQQVIPAYTVYMDGALCLLLWDTSNDQTMRRTITVNLPGSNAMPKEYGLAYVDTNNAPYLPEFLEANELAQYIPGGDRMNGFCTYPLYKFDLSKFEPIEKLLAKEAD